MSSPQGNDLGLPLVTDPSLKAGQDFASVDLVADALMVRKGIGPALDIWGASPSAPGDVFEGDVTPIYGDSLYVGDATEIVAYVLFRLQATTTDANLTLYGQSSPDGVNWYPIGDMDFAAAIAGAPMNRNDAGTAALPAFDGGLCLATTANNIPLPESGRTLLPASRTPAAAESVKRTIPFYTRSYPFFRFVAVPTYGAGDPPLLSLVAQKVT